MSKKLITLFLLTLVKFSFAQTVSIEYRIDSLLSIPSETPFNGTILITREGVAECGLIRNISLLQHISGISINQQYVIGSISKQFTAVLILREYDKGRLQLNTPIRKYLPELKMSWVDSVTIHHLLTHTHGIVALDQPLAFPVGTQFQYSQIGYTLLGDIIETVTGKPFAEASQKMFKRCGMKYSYHPQLLSNKDQIKGYTMNLKGQLIEEDRSYENYVAAGGFISTAIDLTLWNNALHHGRLLSDSTYKLMITPYATREHPIFGPTQYGYGITVGQPNGIIQLGQTGYAPGFISMNFYFPESDTSVIVLENVDWDSENIKNTFYYHVRILKMVTTHR